MRMRILTGRTLPEVFRSQKVLDLRCEMLRVFSGRGYPAMASIGLIWISALIRLQPMRLLPAVCVWGWVEEIAIAITWQTSVMPLCWPRWLGLLRQFTISIGYTSSLWTSNRAENENIHNRQAFDSRVSFEGLLYRLYVVPMDAQAAQEETCLPSLYCPYGTGQSLHPWPCHQQSDV